MTSGPATIGSSTGVLTGGSVTANTTAVIAASYTSGGVTKTASASVTIANVAATLSSITISGPSSVNEGGTGTYAATANWSDGSTSAATGATWSVTSGPATIGSSTGVLTGGSVTANTTAVIAASYTSGGVTKTASKSVTITDVPATTGSVTVFPEDKSVDVPRNTVITATAGDSSDIRTIFNSNTFTLKSSGDSKDSSVGASWPMSPAVCVNDGIVQGVFTYDSPGTTGTFTPNCSLGEDKTYLASIASGNGSPLSATVNWQFKTFNDGPDSDDDGSPDGEDDDPHDGKKASRWGSKGNGKIHIEVKDSAGAVIKSAIAISDDNSRLNQGGKPARFLFHDGLIAYNVEGVTPGGTVTAKLTFPSGIPKGAKIFRIDSNGFKEKKEGLDTVVEGNTLTLTLVDGGKDDGDGLANGVIVDPVGVAVPEETASGFIDISGSGSSGGGCAIAGRSGSAWSIREAAGSYGLLFLVVLGMAVRRRMARREK
ncbi:MAG: hypothetical protein HY896_12475 [Deltaproteobacteria bacterium]|nr:hypothetical protein [Deltaproteobacteria bacterium]